MRLRMAECWRPRMQDLKALVLPALEAWLAAITPPFRVAMTARYGEGAPDPSTAVCTSCAHCLCDGNQAERCPPGIMLTSEALRPAHALGLVLCWRAQMLDADRHAKGSIQM